MAIVKISAAKSPYAAIHYVLDEKPHNGKQERNEFVSYINMDPSLDVIPQFGRVWQFRGDQVSVLVRTVIQSFSRKELDPSDPTDVELAHTIGIQTGLKVFGHRQFFVATQIDGKSGLVHNHIVANNIDQLTYLGMKGQRGNTPAEYGFERVKQISDEVASKYITLDHGEDHGKKRTAVERKHELDNEKIRRENERIDKWNETHADQISHRTEKYVWKDAIRDAIEKCAATSDSWESFTKDLPKYYGVDVKEAKSGRYVTYTLQDTEDYKLAEWNAACERLEKAGSYEVPEIDSFEPKRKLSARDRSLGPKYSHKGVLDMILEAHQDRVDEITAAEEQLEKQAEQRRAEWEVQKKAEKDEEERKKKEERLKKDIAEQNPEKDGTAETDEQNAAAKSVPQPDAHTELSETPQQNADSERHFEAQNVGSEKMTRTSGPLQKTVTLVRKEDPDDITPRDDEEMIPVIGERSHEMSEQKTMRQQREEKELRQRQKRNQRSFWKARRKEDDHAELSEIFQDWRKKSEERKEKGDEDEFGG